MSRLWSWLLLLPLLSGCASETVEREPDGLKRLEVELKREDGYETRWQLAAACLDVIDIHPDIRSGTKLSYAKRALKHADQAVRIDAEQVEGHYYRAIALGRVLEFETLPDLDRIGELEQAAERARAIDPTFKHAGPLRFLALLYTKAPPWPIGPELAGEEDEIEALWEEALQLASGWVENHLGFAEFLVDQDREAEALAHARQARALLAKTRLHPIQHEELRRRIQELFDALKS
ncbi:MAG TPA: hypothetical protein DEA08_21465 [Planctomycetes bacterium]|nr:hypothetical protein [Planctomycetota bacterium]